MKISDTSTPVVVLDCQLGGLSIMRSLGSLGVTLHGVDADPKSPGMLSKYCRKKFYMYLDTEKPDEYLGFLLDIGEELNQKAIIIPTSDMTAGFVSEYYSELSKYFIAPQNEAKLLQSLLSKKGMYHLALKHGIPTPHTEFPQNLEDVKHYLKTASFPVMLKAIDGNKLYARTQTKMVIINNGQELLHYYQKLEDPADPNLMIQELIPGDDEQVYIFNGYFDEHSECQVAFTGHKLRQYPIHVGCASFGINSWNEDVSKLTKDFMKKIGYKGILDIGYRLDPRDGKYKVLDINPRIGQAFRIFTSEKNMDVARALYLDLTNQKIEPSPPRNGRKWIIEDYDLISTYHYFKEGSLTFGQWLRSLNRIEEGAWFNWRDPYPFFWMSKQILKRFINKIIKISLNKD